MGGCGERGRVDYKFVIGETRKGDGVAVGRPCGAADVGAANELLDISGCDVLHEDAGRLGTCVLAAERDELAGGREGGLAGFVVVVCEGTSHGEHRDGPWRADVPEHAAGSWCDVFEIRDWKIHRCFIYLDPDYAGKDTARYPWLDKK